MSILRKPAACSLAWLAVVALVLFSAPTQGPSSVRRSGQETMLGKLASGLGSDEVTQAPGQRNTPSHKLLKPWAPFEGSEQGTGSAPAQETDGAGGLDARTSSPLPRTTLVGIVELRV